MYPLVPARALGGGVAAPRLHAGQKDPWACRERSLTHIVSPSGLVSSCFPVSGYRNWLCQSRYAYMQMDRCCRLRVVWVDRGMYLLLQALNEYGFILLQAFHALFKIHDTRLCFEIKSCEKKVFLNLFYMQRALCSTREHSSLLISFI